MTFATAAGFGFTLTVDELDREHQSQSAHLADDRILRLNLAQSLHQDITDFSSILRQVFVPHDSQCFRSGGGADRIGAVGAAMRARRPLVHGRLVRRPRR